MQAWIEKETHGVNFGDERLDARYQILLDELSEKPSLSIPAACGGQAETTAAYRFFDNAKTDPGKVLAPHRQATLERIRNEPVVIAAQDTTEVDLTRKQEKVGGPLSDDKHWGIHVHPLLVMTPERVPLGVVEAIMWSRDPKELEKTSEERRRERRQKPFEEKESHRWLQGYEAACQIALEVPNTQVICVSDSEGDIYECFAAGAREGQRAEWIVRGCQDRALLEEEKNLLQLLACRAPLGKMKIVVSKREASTGDDRKRRQARDGRTAVVTVRSVRTLLNPPGRKGQKLPPVYVNAVLLREDNPPARRADRMVVDHQPADRDVCGSEQGGQLLLLPLGNRSVFPRPQERLQDRGSPV